MNKKILIGIIVFILSMWLINYGHQNVGPMGLLIMLLGLGGLLTLLYRYNKQYQ